jgi:hypothetical protein
MDLPPPAGKADIRQSDTDALLARIDARCDSLNAKLDRLERRLYMAMAAQTVVVAGLVTAFR